MPRIDALPRAPLPLGSLLGVILAFACSAARAEPPIQGPHDAACRLEAKARVFSTPNPRGLEPEEIGRGIYHACMARLSRPSVRPVRKRHRHRRHRR